MRRIASLLVLMAASASVALAGEIETVGHSIVVPITNILLTYARILLG